MDSDDWKELNDSRRKAWRWAVLEAGRLLMANASWAVPPPILECVADLSFEPAVPRFPWRLSETDKECKTGDLSLECKMGGLVLIAGQTEGFWWWFVDDDAGERADCGVNFPFAFTWRDAVAFAELEAEYILRRRSDPPSAGKIMSLTYLRQVRDEESPRQKSKSVPRFPADRDEHAPMQPHAI